MVARRGKKREESCCTRVCIYIYVCVLQEMAREGSKKGKHKKQLALMTYIKKTSYIGQGIDHTSLFDLVYVFYLCTSSCTQCSDTRTEWSKVGGGWWWKWKDTVTAFHFFHPQMFASASAHSLAGQGLRAGPCGPPEFQTDSLRLNLNLAWLLTRLCRNTPQGRGSNSLQGWSLMHPVYARGNKEKNDKWSQDTKHTPWP